MKLANLRNQHAHIGEMNTAQSNDSLHVSYPKEPLSPSFLGVR